MTLPELISNKDKYFDQIKQRWHSAEDTFPDFLTEVPVADKLQNEQAIDALLTKLNKSIKQYPRLPLGRKKWRNQFFALLKDTLYNEEILHMHHYMSSSEIDLFIDELKAFLREVRSFAPELSFADIGQAIRNYIVYAMFKQIHREATAFHPAAFGYSMLYPFTDNYIDNKALRDEEKSEYNQIIRDTLKGNKVQPKTVHQEKTCRLLHLIEDAYPRSTGTRVFDLLLMMLDAQECSIRQQNRMLPLGFQERLDISVYKGGISVFMDRFFVNKEITEKDLIFYLGFGFFLQLADDLQDIGEDSTQGHSNLFTVNLDPSEEEKVVNKLFHFLHRLMAEYSAENDHFKTFLMNNSYLLILSSVIRSKEFFPKSYLDRLEQYLPVPTDYWLKLSLNRIETLEAGLQSHYLTLLDELIQS